MEVKGRADSRGWCVYREGGAHGSGDEREC